MKTRFNSYDIVRTITELQQYVGMRVNNIYDIDSRTYLIRLQRSQEKAVLLIESGNRFHTTDFEWPKNIAPSGFSMKMRKHLKNKRLEKLQQIGNDRIVDMQFGSVEAANHIIIELYDKGNVILTDFEYTILNVLRPHTEGDKFKFAVREKYPSNRAREDEKISEETLRKILENGKSGDQLKKVLVVNLQFGPSIIEHVLLGQGFSNSTKIGKSFNLEEDMEKLLTAINEAESMFIEARKPANFKGYIIQKREPRPANADKPEETTDFYSNQDFHPYLFRQDVSKPHKEFATFNAAVDEFFSGLESQKLELRALQQEREALKKLENIKKDHQQRLVALEEVQELNEQKAELITRNQTLVDSAILGIQTAIANQMSWDDIENLVKDATEKNDPVAGKIKQLKLETNHITLFLTDPYKESGDEDEDEDHIPSMAVDVDLGLTAFANARRYYEMKRGAAKKQNKTIESQSKAFKSAEKKTKQTLKDVQIITNINKSRKVYWFEKFFWFISSENYLVIAGRDQQQNELIVKRYMKPKDVYVHADVHGASSVIIKNPAGQEVPPKTLNESGTMAICYSVAWDAKVVTNAYWVWGEQVSRTAPTGEYLTTGSFMIRGKKNFLPLSQLVLGFGFMFKLEESSVARHQGERKLMVNEDDQMVIEKEEKEEEEVEIIDESDDEDKHEDDSKKSDEKENVEEQEIAESSESENESKFPDTQIKIQHVSGTKINILPEPVEQSEDDLNEEQVVYLGDDKPIILRQNQRNRGNSESKSKQKPEPKKIIDDEKLKQPQLKRGQKNKLKKIKKKYKDQDEEERMKRMEILQSAGTPKEPKRKKKGKNDNNMKKNEPRASRPVQPRKEIIEDGNEEEPPVQDELDMIDSLTGIPTNEDELLFAVPIVAPYNTLANYKFKVKLTPGTGKRGKAANTAVDIFLRDRSVTQRERDLLKAVKNDQLARNLPGKVKIYAPKLHSHKK